MVKEVVQKEKITKCSVCNGSGSYVAKSFWDMPQTTTTATKMPSVCSQCKGSGEVVIMWFEDKERKV